MLLNYCFLTERKYILSKRTRVFVIAYLWETSGGAQLLLFSFSMLGGIMKRMRISNMQFISI